MFKEQAPSSHRVPASAGLSFPESKLLSGKRAEAAILPRMPEMEKYEARQRVHASAFSRSSAGRRAAILDHPSFRSLLK